jgi:hypothetical protein
MTGTRSPVASYRVEVSGWDSQGAFFVETTTLEWSEEAGKRVFLRSTVASGEIVFVRLLDSAGRQQIPVACQVVGVCGADGRGCYELALAPVQPASKQRTRPALPDSRETEEGN